MRFPGGLCLCPIFTYLGSGRLSRLWDGATLWRGHGSRAVFYGVYQPKPSIVFMEKFFDLDPLDSAKP